MCREHAKFVGNYNQANLYPELEHFEQSDCPRKIKFNVDTIMHNIL